MSVPPPPTPLATRIFRLRRVRQALALSLLAAVAVSAAFLLTPSRFPPAIPGDDALGTLTAQERTAFVLRHFEGLSIEEIGDALGTGVNATKNSIFRAVQKLRRALEPVVSAAR